MCTALDCRQDLLVNDATYSDGLQIVFDFGDDAEHRTYFGGKSATMDAVATRGVALYGR